MTNLSLETLLDILAQAGTVELTRIKNPVYASPHLRGKPPCWKCEVRLPGYLNSGWTQSFVTAEGATSIEAANALYDVLEKWLNGPQGEQARQRYEDSYRRQTERWDMATSYEKNAAFDRIRKPTAFVERAKIKLD